MTTQTAGARFRALLSRNRTLPMPAVWDALTARIVADIGWEAAFIGGFSISVSVLGRSDSGYITQTELLDVAHRVTDVVDIPVIMDCENGFGSPLNAARTVQLFEKAGVAGLFIEDLMVPKRPAMADAAFAIERPEVVVNKIKAAVDARKDESFLIIGRTDKVGSIEEAIERTEMYAEAGADATMIIGYQTADQIRQACRNRNRYHITTQVHGAINPMVGLDDLHAAGINALFYPGVPFCAAYDAAWTAARDFKEKLEQNPHLPPPPALGFDTFNRLEILAEREKDARMERLYVSGTDKK